MQDAAGHSPISRNTPVRFRDTLPEAVDVVIIGGGVIGVFTALYLARAGKSVLLCEKGRVAGEQSSRNWGWLRQTGRDPAEVPIMMQALDLWRDADTETGGKTGFNVCGVTYLARNEHEMERREAWLPVARDHGISSTALSAAKVSDLFGGQSRSWIGAVQTPSDARAEPWQAVPAVAELAQQDGALIREDCAVRALDQTAGKITGVVTEQGRVLAEQVVLAGGAWSSMLARQHGVMIPQLAVRSTAARTVPMDVPSAGNAADGGLSFRRRQDGGYTLAITDKQGFYIGPDAFRHLRKFLPMVLENVSHTDFRLAAPAGFPDAWRTPRRWRADQPSPFETTRVLEPSPDQRYVERMQTRFADRFPSLGRPQICDAWAGMIDAMPDVVPVVDQVASLPGLILATGMSGHGFGIGPGFGRAIARMICGQQPEHDLNRFRFGRFSDGSKLVMGPSL
ncbi:MAG: FAD-binding oxidoreductase [Rhodobacteraceae bacterium]|nr:FAD-binding oxidoreductase [Paracoccaceae bacterium]